MANNNISNFNKKMEAFAKKVEDRIVEVLGEVAYEVIRWIDWSVPVLTGNLHDSTGIGVYKNGRLVKYIPRQIAVEPRNVKGLNLGEIYSNYNVAEDRPYWGYQEIQTALEAASTDYINGVYIVVFSPMPYAIDVDLRPYQVGGGYFSEDIVSGLIQEVQVNLIEMSRVKA